MPLLELSFASGETSLSVRRFTAQEAISGLFAVNVWARSPNQDLDLEAIVGKTASLHVIGGWKHAALGGTRRWTGVCSHIEQVQAEPTGLSTYALRIVPELWLLTQRRGNRIYQHLSIPDITDKLLGEWGIAPTWKIDRGAYPKLEYKVQYGESDHAFLARLWEEAGIAFTFPDDAGDGSRLTLGDKLHTAELRAAPPVHFVDNPSQSAEKEFVTEVRISHEVRPGAHTLRDYDFRRPGFPLFGQAPKAPPPEDRYEQYEYRAGAFLVEGGKGGDTPVADDKGVARNEQKFGDGRAERALLGERMGKRSVLFTTNVIGLGPGVIFNVANHPHTELSESARLLMTSFEVEGTPGEEWTMTGHAVFAETPYRPPLVTPRPVISGVQSATVVGPAGQEIHTDEFGRVRVQFPWDREGKNDDGSSCWIRVSQGWSGTGFGMIMTPRLGQEVLVGFLGGDPDDPIIVGRVFNNKNPVPYKLPEHKTRSTWKSDSSLGSNGFNEIMFEDLKGSELVYVQAQKNLRKLVKNDETITVGNNRQKLVKANETETTLQNRTEVTVGNRTEVTVGNRTTVIGMTMQKLVKEQEVERTDGSYTLLIGRDQHLMIKETKRELVEGNSHLRVKGFRNEEVDNTQSLIVGQDRQERVGNNVAIEAGKEIHFKAGASLVLEAAQDITLKGPGGFIRIDAGGVTIQGTLVRINSGGAAGSGTGATTVEPELPREAKIDDPLQPIPDDVGKTGLAQ
ncbi:MAG: type VI secretion system tip protein TssI/VgrG [Byssovorax sp.]